jgi:hypothetical protein
MLTTLILAAVLSASPTVFEVQTELQALYDEITNGTAQLMTPSELDLFHSVLYARDFVFVDTAGHTHEWPEIREQEIRAIGTPLPDSAIQSILKLSLTPAGATAVVTRTVVRAIVDKDGCYGRKGAMHTLTEVTPFRDLWIRADTRWLLKQRAQTGATKTSVDKHD